MKLQSIQIKFTLFYFLLTLCFVFLVIIYFPLQAKKITKNIVLNNYQIINSILQKSLSRKLQEHTNKKTKFLNSALDIYKNEKSTSSDIIKLAIFDSKLSYLAGFNTQDTDKIGISYNQMKLIELKNTFQINGPLLSRNNKIIGYYKVDYNKALFNQESTSFFDFIIIFAFIIVFLTTFISFFFIKKVILQPINEVLFKLHEQSMKTLKTSVSLNKGSETIQTTMISQKQNFKSLINTLEEVKTEISNSYSASKNAYLCSEQQEKQSENSSLIMKEMSQSILDILQASHDTEKIILSLNEIAKKSDILTLNAFVEVNHTGESGKAFSIIAEEIKKLSSKSTLTVQSSSTLIKSCIEKSQKGQFISKELSDSLNKLSKNTQESYQHISQIKELTKNYNEKISLLDHQIKKEYQTSSLNISSNQLNQKNIQKLHEQTIELIKTINDLNTLFSTPK
ncbi:MAG: hypothetical protein COB02_15110 [Candidatus Cloacimonadota bacterium]|nr:MAG: hypothetical protein COB02_15110 [Candidatus Cloacimonadota bacterium]